MALAPGASEIPQPTTLRMPLSKASPSGTGSSRWGCFLSLSRRHTRRPLAEGLEGRQELGLDLDHVLLEPTLSGNCLAGDTAGLGMGLLHDQIRFAAGLRLHLLSGTLSGDERRAKERLELVMPSEFGLEFLHARGKVSALAPDRLEAIGGLVEELSTSLRRYPRSHARRRST